MFSKQAEKKHREQGKRPAAQFERGLDVRTWRRRSNVRQPRRTRRHLQTAGDTVLAVVLGERGRLGLGGSPGGRKADAARMGGKGGCRARQVRGVSTPDGGKKTRD